MGVLKNLAHLVKMSWMPGLASVQARLMGPFYRTVFMSALARCGLLGAMSGNRALSGEEAALFIGAEDQALVERWLELGVATKVLRRDTRGRFRLRALEARMLAKDGTGVGPAGLLEVVLYHTEAILSAPRIAASGGILELGEEGQSVIARSTRVVEPFIKAAIRELVEQARPHTWLEVGAGDGEYALHALQLQPELRMTCIDREPILVRRMRQRFEARGVCGAVTVEHCDVRDLSDRQFDVVTLYNLIYYFHKDERVAVLKRCAELLEPGGSLLLTTSIPGKVLAVSALDLWFRCSEARSGLPTEPEIRQLFREAGFKQLRLTRPLPGLSFVAVEACREGAE